MAVFVSERAAPSQVCELAWLLDLLVQRARYAEPALDELDRALLPGIAALRLPIKKRIDALWGDRLSGCPELLVATDVTGDLFGRLSTLPGGDQPEHALLSERAADRRLIRHRLARLSTDIRLRRTYRNVLAEVWSLAGPIWEKRGRLAATKAASEWNRRLAPVKTPRALIRLMPPRHPLTRTDDAPALLRRRSRIALVPIYFSMSGGIVADLDDRLLIGVPASGLEPVRRRRDASFVADRMRILAETTRVHILIHLMSAPSGVMEITRALHMSQPVVSEHVRVLAAAGLVRPKRKGARTLYVVRPGRVDRLLEDARATIGRWVV